MKKISKFKVLAMATTAVATAGTAHSKLQQPKIFAADQTLCRQYRAENLRLMDLQLNKQIAQNILHMDESYLRQPDLQEWDEADTHRAIREDRLELFKATRKETALHKKLIAKASKNCLT